jgi:hypothetical protein
MTNLMPIEHGRHWGRMNDRATTEQWIDAIDQKFHGPQLTQLCRGIETFQGCCHWTRLIPTAQIGNNPIQWCNNR